MKDLEYNLNLNETLENWYDAQFSINSFKDSLIKNNDKSNGIIKTIMEITIEIKTTVSIISHNAVSL